MSQKNIPQFKKTLFIFRRDLRISDNTGLIYALENSQVVIPAFIFTPDQIEKNAYRSDACLQFMIESLEDLSEQIKERGGKLYLFYGVVEEVIERVLKKFDIDGVVVNRDYTPFSQKRDKKIEKLCNDHQVAFISCDDALLHPPEETLKADGTPYSVFTPYYRNASRLEVANPRPNRRDNYFHGKIAFEEGAAIYQKILPNRSSQLIVKGGRKEGAKILKKLGEYAHYAAERDFPALHATTHLSAYLKFTIFSPREIYHAVREHLGTQHELVRALYWRDFFSAIALFSPHVFKGAYHSKFDQLQWSDDKVLFKRWCEGRTGFPLVDAGMRELNQTGFMHNRVRMLVASFLVKDLHLDWRWGEKYFAQKLIDYDPAVNNGNWQWAASTGCDAQPYFRIFNPWNQQKKFDPDCLYIKQWVPELQNLDPKMIHRWYEKQMQTLCPNYPAPVVEHAQEAKVALRYYKSI